MQSHEDKLIDLQKMPTYKDPWSTSSLPKQINIFTCYSSGFTLCVLKAKSHDTNTGIQVSSQKVTTVSQTSVTVQGFKCTTLRVVLRTPDGTAMTFLSNDQLLMKPDLDDGVTHTCLSKAGSSRLQGAAVSHGRRSHTPGSA